MAVAAVLGLVGGMASSTLLPQAGLEWYQQQWWHLWSVKLADPFTLAEAYRRGLLSKHRYEEILKFGGYDDEMAKYYFKASNKMLEINEIIQYYHKGLLNEDEVKENLKRYGLEDKNIELIISGSYEYLPINIVMELYRRGILSESDTKERMKILGIKEDEFKLLNEFSNRLYDLSSIITMRFRGLIDESKYKDEMKKLGYNEEKAKNIFEIAHYYPNPEDFIRFAVRDVFNPDRVKKYNLDTEFPKAILPYSRKSGIKDDILKWYWMAHWELPSPEMVMRMVNILQPDVINTKLPNGERYGDKYKHFGLNPDKLITTYDDMSEFEAMADISPYWRDRIKALTFPPITRVDLRRMYELGLISDEELKARLLELGYSLYDVDKIIQFYKAYKTQHEKDLTKSEILNLYEIDAISDKDAVEMLSKIGYSEDEAKYILSLASFRKYKKVKEEYIKILVELYGNGSIDDNELIANLGKMDISSTEIDYWEEKAKHERIKHQKIPNHKELISMFRQGVINEDEFKEYMKRNGFNDYWVKKYIKMIKGTGE